MRIGLLRDGQNDATAIRFGDGPWVWSKAVPPLRRLGLYALLLACLEPDVVAAAAEAYRADGIPIVADPAFGSPLRPGKVLGIGLNYVDHANDLGAAPPVEPASFLKAEHCIIGAGDEIRLPHGVGRITSEAELGVVIGRECYQVDPAHALGYVAGVCAILDQTAEDVLLRNPRFLTRAKNYPTFLSLGPEIVTLDELGGEAGLLDRTISTIRNGNVEHTNRVAGMIFDISTLIAFHSMVMPFAPGDVISTGTPGAIEVNPGDLMTCQIDGLLPLVNPVVG